ncbi:ABC transporter permease [Actinobacteria bacterium YIM 96077]|uniref:ABC transporter permease n=1 Tax=Phytoactinopolyspora halophila TaxID=1981511 RepID=A0A329QB32_9ACTN|nr:ABC transporter permease [Phytoactinopolyspora halophila]AYY14149.1 ABC transporter permease [Actinobacteria bacterium YIM 96077]RAW09610.1 ABC transporter permease [Phytoactinopolyspora halophila]
MSTDTPAPSRLRPRDTVRVAFSGLRARPLRAVLSALGIAVGIAAMVAVVGISASSQERVNQQLRELGTDMLTVSPGTSFTGEAKLPEGSVDMIDRIGAVNTSSAVGMLDDINVYRNDEIDPNHTNALAVTAARTDLLDTVSGSVASGRWLDDALADYPAVVLGSTAAERLGISRTDGSIEVWLGDQWFTVVGVLDPVPLAPELDSAAMIGWPIATDLFDFDGSPTTIYERSGEESVDEVAGLLPSTVNPSNPEEVEVSRPSDALAARAAVDETLSALLLALGGVALIVGGIGVANTMVIAVLERRSEVGLRRALGATRPHIRRQFLGESILLAGLGGVGGALLGGLVTAAFAANRGWQVAVPMWVLGGAAAATIVVGALAGAYPAARAARMPPTAALATA